MQIDLGTSPKPAASGFIKDTDELHFEQDVLTASQEKPVIVDFWAPWCGPCKQLTPALEKAVNAATGAVTLVKVNVDKNPGLSQALRIQSIPTIYAFYQGKPVDGFAGARPESEIKAFVSKLAALGNPQEAEKANAEEVKKMLTQADEFFQAGKLDDAMVRYGGVLDADGENMEALGGIGWCLLTQGDAPAVKEMLSQLSPEQLAAPRLKGLQFILSLGDEAQNLEGYIDRLVADVKKNRAGGAREKLLEIFEAMGNAHPLTMSGRRKLSAVLFS